MEISHLPGVMWEPDCLPERKIHCLQMAKLLPDMQRFSFAVILSFPLEVTLSC